MSKLKISLGRVMFKDAYILTLISKDETISFELQHNKETAPFYGIAFDNDDFAEFKKFIEDVK